jgi:hypothetical protein
MEQKQFFCRRTVGRSDEVRKVSLNLELWPIQKTIPSFLFSFPKIAVFSRKSFEKYQSLNTEQLLVKNNNDKNALEECFR